MYVPNGPLIDYDEGVRMAGGNQSLYLRMLSRFAHEPTVSRLESAVLRGDIQDAFLQAHTLKGLCAQLALPSLHAAASSMCDLLRRQQPEEIARAGELLTGVLSVYQQTLYAINSH